MRITVKNKPVVYPVKTEEGNAYAIEINDSEVFIELLYKSIKEDKNTTGKEKNHESI